MLNLTTTATTTTTTTAAAAAAVETVGGAVPELAAVSADIQRCLEGN